MKRKFFFALLCSGVVALALTNLLQADEIKNAGLVQSVKNEYRSLWASSLQKYVDGIERAEKADDQYRRDTPGCKVLYVTSQSSGPQLSPAPSTVYSVPLPRMTLTKPLCSGTPLT
jgi:hypothetical protein